MFAALIPQLLPLIGKVVDKTIPDKVQRDALKGVLETSLIENAHTINMETIKTNQIEAQHRSIWVAGWRPAIGWSCAAGIFWMFIGVPILSWAVALSGNPVELPVLPHEILLEMTLAMLGMSALRSFDKLKGLTK